jgi:hypothetical protein
MDTPSISQQLKSMGCSQPHAQALADAVALAIKNHGKENVSYQIVPDDTVIAKIHLFFYQGSKVTKIYYIPARVESEPLRDY